MAKPVTQKIKLVSTAGTGFYYVTKKNPRNQTEKLVFKKYDPVEVRLVEAIPTAGALRFEMLSEGRSLGGAGAKPKRPGAPHAKGKPQGKRGPRQQAGGASRKRR